MPVLTHDIHDFIVTGCIRHFDNQRAAVPSIGVTLIALIAHPTDGDAVIIIIRSRPFNHKVCPGGGGIFGRQGGANSFNRQPSTGAWPVWPWACRSGCSATDTCPALWAHAVSKGCHHECIQKRYTDCRHCRFRRPWCNHSCYSDHPIQWQCSIRQCSIRRWLCRVL